MRGLQVPREDRSALRPVRGRVQGVRAAKIQVAPTLVRVRNPRERIIAQDPSRPGTHRLQRVMVAKAAEVVQEEEPMEVQEEKEPDADVQRKDVTVLVDPVQESPVNVEAAVAVPGAHGASEKFMPRVKKSCKQQIQRQREEHQRKEWRQRRERRQKEREDQLKAERRAEEWRRERKAGEEREQRDRKRKDQDHEAKDQREKDRKARDEWQRREKER